MEHWIKCIAREITEVQIVDFVNWMKSRDERTYSWLVETRNQTMRDSMVNALWHEFKDEFHII